MNAREFIVITQAMTFVALGVLTFVALGVLLVTTGETRLGLAQVALAVVTWLVYA